MNVGIEFLKREAACFGMLRAIAEQLEIFPETPQRTTVGNRVYYLLTYRIYGHFYFTFVFIYKHLSIPKFLPKLT